MKFYLLLLILILSIVSIVLSGINLKNKYDNFANLNEDDLFVTCINKDDFRCLQHSNCQWNSRLSGPFGSGSCRMSRQLMGSFGNPRILRS